MKRLLLLALATTGAALGQTAADSAFRWVADYTPGRHPGVRHATYFSRIHDQPVGYAVYLPPGYDADDSRRYPVVYYLHGGRPGGETKALSLTYHLDRIMRSGAVPPMIYVFPNGGVVSHYDYPELKSYGETAFITELIPVIESKYRTVATRAARGVEGFSQGGRAAARIAFKYPHLFASAVSMSGGQQVERSIADHGGKEPGESHYVFQPGNNTWDLARTFASGPAPKPRLLVTVGEKDANHDGNVAWMDHLRAMGIVFESQIVPGVGHESIRIYEKIGPRVMQFHAGAFTGQR
jgi:enterochelin esterase-like enzyme